MTLAEVAARQRNVHAHESHLADDYPCAACVASEVAAAFEADPDFTLRERIEVVIKRWDQNAVDPHAEDNIRGRPASWDELADVLCELLEPPKNEKKGEK